MITPEKLAELRKWHGGRRYQIDKQADTWIGLNELCDTIEALWKVAKAAEQLIEFEHFDEKEGFLRELDLVDAWRKAAGK
jgi:hypothetical protein